MILFCTGLIIGAIAGMFSWLAAAAYIESKRMHMEFSELFPAQPELTQGATDPAFKLVESRAGHRIYQDRRAALVIANETTRKTTRPSAS